MKTKTQITQGKNINWKRDFNWNRFLRMELLVVVGVLLVLFTGLPFYGFKDWGVFIIAPLGCGILFIPVGVVLANKLMWGLMKQK